MLRTGLYVPLITPFTASGELAPDALAALAHAVLADGAAGLVALGTTAEAAALTPEERGTVIEICAAACARYGAPLVAGAGTNTTAASIEQLAGLDPRISAALTVVPYYTRPSEDGVVEHFRLLAAACPVPLIVYNIPYRTGRALSAETLGRIASIPNIAGFKHSTGGIDETTIAFLADLPADVAVLAGDDLFTAPMLALGASGAILACANIAARPYAELIAAWRAGSIEHARQLGHRLVPLTRALFTEPNPTVLKAVLAAEGRIPSPHVRLPLLPARPESTAAALACVEQLGLGQTSRG
ncbi:4-hydroxy-tetrahydrodipicolinate synthase [Nocardia asteroides]|uniref:4-hydroxy-tetrahydrodipicolinate synthase n=1 Tax=Nocardia asteroides TaxID=1824 RepID=UPI001E4A33AD|nr:4-hydroxy-tetrahydrodipicolinate synthase [Nocardia asteroides]UGT64500.1 4-hydroxy-tetrahydrodipicolinate synthase [Nocardia asteroides]